ncbi:hypothetical protein ACXONV_09630, partial [Streptococcus thermophilus]
AFFHVFVLCLNYTIVTLRFKDNITTYKQNKQELDIVMPFSKEKRLSKYILGYTLGLLLLLTIWSISVYFSGFQITMVWSMSNFRLLILFFLGYGFQGMAEEIVCRGYLQGRLMKITQKKSSNNY